MCSSVSKSTIGRIWKTFELKPHRVEGFKFSKDPLFVEKVYDIIGLYLNPPETAFVLCVDEKSQVQALDRSQPVLPMMPGMPEKRTHDYFRNRTTSLFAATGLGGDDLHPFAQANFPFMRPSFQELTTPTLVIAGDHDQSKMSSRGPDWFTDAMHTAPAPPTSSPSTAPSTRWAGSSDTKSPRPPTRTPSGSPSSSG